MSSKMTVQSLRHSIEQLKGRRNQILQQITAAQHAAMESKRSLRRHEQAREIIREVGLKTQRQLQYNISEITTLALASIWDDPYELVAEFVMRRNKTECDLYFKRGEEQIDPLSASGGGAVDVAAFALRAASWSMRRPRSRPTLILDEPFRFLSENLLPKASEMLKQISSRLGLQIIMVTHSEELMEAADRIFRVSICDGKSKVEML